MVCCFFFTTHTVLMMLLSRLLHSFRLVLHRPILVHRWFKLFHTIHLLLCSGVRSSVGIIHAVSFPIFSLHLSILYSLGVLIMHFVLFIELFLDLSQYVFPCVPCIMYWVPVINNFSTFPVNLYGSSNFGWSYTG